MRTRLALTVLLLHLVAFPFAIDAREPTAPKTKRHHKTSSKELVWDASRPEERILRYNVYEKIVDRDQNTTWKKIATVEQPRYTIRHMRKGKRVFAVSSVSAMGESQRSPELVVEK